MKSAFVAIIGRPSAGKSTLLNKICGRKISITAESPQTTRNKIRGVFTDERGQIVFIDTPGFHLSDKKLNNYLSDAAISSLTDADAVLYVLDLTRLPGEEESGLLDILTKAGLQLVPVLNKCDLAQNGQNAKFYEKMLAEAGVIGPYAEVSAISGEGLENMLDGLFAKLPEGELMYPEEFYTDQDPQFRAAEIIREKALRRVRQELPHSLYVEIADMEQREDILWIRAFLVAERDSQKGILVGKGGQVIKKIREGSLRELKKIFPGSVRLDLRVKVNKKWRNKDNLLKSMFGRNGN